MIHTDFLEHEQSNQIVPFQFLLSIAGPDDRLLDFFYT